jgi:colicin import membrane protein
MARSGVRPEQVFATAEALVREGQNPTVMAVRTRLGGGSPNTITPLLAEWKALHEKSQAAGIPAPPEPVEAVLRQVWGAAWQQAQAQLEGEREALSQAHKEIAKEREAMLAEIARMDSELDAARETIRETGEALEEERRARERVASEAREARALADEREKRITAQEKELQDLRGQIEGLRIETATLTERAAHVDELRAVLKTLQGQQGRGEGTGRAKRRAKPEGSA